MTSRELCLNFLNWKKGLPFKILWMFSIISWILTKIWLSFLKKNREFVEIYLQDLPTNNCGFFKNVSPRTFWQKAVYFLYGTANKKPWTSMTMNPLTRYFGLFYKSNFQGHSDLWTFKVKFNHGGSWQISGFKRHYIQKM